MLTQKCSLIPIPGYYLVLLASHIFPASGNKRNMAGSRA